MAQITLERRKGAVLGWLEAFEPFTIASVRPVSAKRPDLAIVSGEDEERVMVLAGGLTDAYETRFGKSISWSAVSADKERVTIDDSLFKGKTLGSSSIDDKIVLVIGGETANTKTAKRSKR